MTEREKLIEILGGMPGIAWSPAARETIADHLIANGVTVQKWIPVTERLPELNPDGTANAVLVTDGCVQHMAYFVNGEWIFAESGEMKEPMWYKVTHWMPLPNPPKEVSP